MKNNKPTSPIDASIEFNRLLNKLCNEFIDFYGKPLVKLIEKIKSKIRSSNTDKN